LIVILAARHILDGKAGADLDAFDGSYAEHSAKLGVELAEDRLTQTHRHARDDYFDYSAC
jgi:hypothetical protein